MRKLKLGLAAAALVLAGSALAQVPGLFVTSPTGSEQINVLGSGPQIETIFLRQARDAAGFSKQSPTSGTVSFTNNVSQVQIGGSVTISALTINLAASPINGQMNCFYTKPAITTLTLAAPSGTLNDGVTSTSATTRYCYLYSAADTSWDRVQ